MVRSIIAASALLSLASIVAAQSATPMGYGRFPCTIVNGDNTFSPDQSQCASDLLVNPGADDNNTGNQGDRTNPVNPECVQELETGAYFCGIAGATCTSDANCDNGVCTDGICQGGFTQECGSTDSNCSGFLYCISNEFETTPTDTCGGFNSYCQDPTQGSIDFTNAENYAIFNQFCESGYCNFGSAACDVHGTNVGDDCSTDPEFKCTETSLNQRLTCDQTTFTCQLAIEPSGRARERRNLARRNICPASHEACPSANGGVECVDVMTSLEQCGGCANAGGVDCSALEGVSSSSCQFGRCEIWACADGYTWNSSTETCVAN
ncbi:uncharacterized protein JCM6883_005319 [Sporobolomyces salmoneus]|uniref:uncharacterized protein n=1 Tax=Sporobolomyces salmoneus TaxID=183962 RepID=UPI00317D3A24